MPKMKYKRPRRRGGRTVYRNKRTTPASKRNSVYSTIKVILCIAGLAVLVFLGYSIGAPIHRYFEERKAVLIQRYFLEVFTKVPGIVLRTVNPSKI